LFGFSSQSDLLEHQNNGKNKNIQFKKWYSFFVGMIKFDIGSNNLKLDKCQESK
jgi:hypothetical protein